MAAASVVGVTERVRAARVLVIAPHFDDEVLGCGGLLSQLAADGARIAVLFLSDGAGAPGERGGGEYAARRRAECERATRTLGIAERINLGLPDGTLDWPVHIAKAGRAVAEHLRAADPDLVLAPSPLEVSSDHRAAADALHRALESVRPDREHELRQLTILLYEVNHALHPNLLVDVSASIGAIERAMACYPSQQEQHNYLAAAIGLRQFRTITLGTGVTHAEAYRRLSGWDAATRSAAQFITYVGGAYRPPPVTGPLVSVVVRTLDRPRLLAEALGSLADGVYRDVEVVLVNDGGAAPAVPADYPFPVTRVEHATTRGRAAAAQAGVEAARGEYVAFLDDDDLAAPEHLSTLVHAAESHQARVVYSLAAVGIYERHEAPGWRCVTRVMQRARAFDHARLLADNFIPINTLLIDRTLFAQAGPFDESLEIFEDWDMLIRLAVIAPFHHVPAVTCEYRLFRGASGHTFGDQGWRRPDFAETKARIAARHAQRPSPRAWVRAARAIFT